jgi:periplasmic protein TonB
MPQRRIVTLASVVVHIVVLTAFLVAQVLAVGPLPIPHQPLMFDSIEFVQLKDIPVPPVPRVGPTQTPSLGNVAPIDPPEGITKETGLEGLGVTRPSIDTGLVVERGVGSFGLEIVGAAPPPPEPTPQRPIHLHAGMQPPSKIVDVAPQYPPIARAAHVEGVVILEAVIDADGSVTSVKVLRSIPLLDDAAVKAVRAWRFTPARLNDQAVPVVMTVTVNFTLQPYR